MGAGIVLFIAHIITMFLPECNDCYTEFGPMILIGLGYSIYGASLWSSIPYVVKPKTVGTAFGIALAG